MVAINSLDDDGPAWRKDGVVDVQVIGFEGKASKDGRDSDGLSIGQMEHTWRHIRQQASVNIETLNDA